MTEDLQDMKNNPLRVAAALFTLLIFLVGVCGAPLWYVLSR
jgi:hypothetical protein